MRLSTRLSPSSDGAVAAATVRRVRLADSTTGKLFFAQVREDPLLELEALQQQLEGPIVIVSSGGCTALSLVAAGAGDVVAVDLNRTQNSVVELKAVGVAVLGSRDASAFIGGAPMSGNERLRTYARLRAQLGPDARAYWDGHRRAIAKGLLGAGVTERFFTGVIAAVRALVHPKWRMDRLLACRTLDEQQAFYRDEWNSPRWRALFRLMFNGVVFNRVYEPAFFEHVGEPSFAKHFHGCVEHAVTELPVETNYFLHYLLRGEYPVGVPGGLPPYLDPENEERLGAVTERLTLVDGSMVAYLQGCPSSSIAGFSLSNICEWLSDEQLDTLLGEVVRTAKPGARLCLRNFVGWTEIPDRWRANLRVDAALGDRLIKGDRSLGQRRIVVADVAP